MARHQNDHSVSLHFSFICGSSATVLEDDLLGSKEIEMVSPVKADPEKVKEAAQALINAYAANAETIAMRLLDPTRPTDFAEAVLAEVRRHLGICADR